MKFPIDTKLSCAAKSGKNESGCKLARNWKISASSSRAKQKEATRARILKAAFELFEADGFYETTTSAIAKKAKVSAGSIYAHFGSPGRILSELHAAFLKERAERLRQLRAAWPEDRNAWDLLLAMLDEVWGVNKDVRMENVSAYQSWAWVCSSEDYVPMAEMYGEIITELASVVEAAQSEGTIPSDIDARTTIEVLTATFFQGLQEARHGHDENMRQNALFKQKVHTMFQVTDPPLAAE